MREHRKLKPEVAAPRIPWGKVITALVGIAGVIIAYLALTKTTISEEHGRAQINSSIQSYEVLLARTRERIPAIADRALSEFGKRHGTMVATGQLWHDERVRQFGPVADSVSDRWRFTDREIMRIIDDMGFESADFADLGRLSEEHQAFTALAVRRDSTLALLLHEMQAY